MRPNNTQSNSQCASHASWLKPFLVLLFIPWVGSAAYPQSNLNPLNQNTGINDPSVVRQPGYRLQQTQPSEPVPQIVVQPTGQRVFPTTQDARSASNASTLSPVQPASWTSDASSQGTSNSVTRKPLELKARSKDAVGSLEKPKSTWAAALSMFFSLAIVLSLFLMIAWLFRKAQPSTFLKLPAGAVQVLGRTAMAPRQQLYVVRFGNKMLLVSHQPGQTQTLGEITDTEEVQRIAGLCEANMPNSVTHSFRDILKQVATGRPDNELRTISRKRTTGTT